MKRFLSLLAFVWITFASAVAQEAQHTNTSKVFFPFAIAKLSPSFRDNANSLSLLDSLTQQLDVAHVERIHILGSASPEGDKWFNEQLSQQRAKALGDYLKGKVNLTDSLLESDFIITNEKGKAVTFADHRFAELSVVLRSATQASPDILQAVAQPAETSKWS